MLIDISEDAYFNLFPIDPHPFLSRKFLNLNKSKIDRILYLIDDTSKPSLGLIAGVKDAYLFSPFSAPFGGFHFIHELLHASLITDFIDRLKKYILKNNYRGIEIVLPPDIYHQTINAKITNSLFTARFEINHLDITCWINLEVFQDQFNFKRANECFNQARKNGLVFRQVDENSEKLAAYQLIKDNRNKFGRPIFMTFDDIENIRQLWPIDFFTVNDKNNELLASAIFYRSHSSIVYAVFWGDNEIGRKHRAMTFLIFNLLKFYKKEGYKYVDISKASENGIINEGLLRFKETHQGISSIRYTFKWSNPEASTFEAITKNKLMEPFKKYGIILRLVVEHDADFILNLRTDPKLRKYISATNPDLVEQINWIKNYKVREKEGKEYYFIAQDQNGNKYGTIRLYNPDKNSFEIGSWLFAPNSPLGMAVKAHVLGYEIGFEYFKADLCKFDVRKENRNVLKYVEFFRPQRIGEDDLNVYFHLTKENFYQRKDKLSIFSSSEKNPKYKPVIHNTSEVQSKKIGEGTIIWQHCVVLENAVIGKNCNLNYNVFVENDVIIGDNVTIKSGVQLWDGIRLEDNVFISPNVTFTNDFAPRSKQYPSQFLMTRVKEGASIGANSTIIGGITIGRYAMIGAGSMVTKNIPDFTLWYGNPAIMKAYICKCGQKLNTNYACPGCQLKYALSDGTLIEI